MKDISFMDVYEARYSGKADESLIYTVQYLKQKYEGQPVFVLFRGSGCSTDMTGITKEGKKVPFYVTSGYDHLSGRFLVYENGEWFIFEDGEKKSGKFPDIVLEFFAKEGIEYGSIPPSCWAMAVGKESIKFRCQG